MMAVARGVRLRGVFQDAKIVAGGDFEDRMHVRGAAVKMNGNDGARARSDGALEKPWIDVSGGRIDIDEDWASAAIRDGFRCGEEGIWRGDDFVAGLDAHGEQSEMQRGSSAAQGDAMGGPAEIGKFALESSDVRTFDECGILAGAIEGGENFVAQARVFGFQIEKWNFHGQPFSVLKNFTVVRATRQAAGVEAKCERMSIEHALKLGTVWQSHPDSY